MSTISVHSNQRPGMGHQDVSSEAMKDNTKKRNIACVVHSFFKATKKESSPVPNCELIP